MKVFKYLVALADISVGFLGLFFVLFAVTRPALRESAEIERLKNEVRLLQELQLSRAGAGGETEKLAAKIYLRQNDLTVMLDQKEQSLKYKDFAAAAKKEKWPNKVALYVDQRLPFNRVVAVIDALKQSAEGVQVQIAALKKAPQ